MFKLAPLPRNVEAALRDAAHLKIEVRLSAVEDLGRLAAGPEHRRVVAKLVEVLTADASDEVRARAAVALADAGAVSERPSLLHALKDASDRVRQMAMLALGELGKATPAELDAVRAALRDPVPELRFQALVALHHLSGQDTERVLNEMLIDPDAEVRFVAIRIAEERFVEAKRSGPPWLLERLTGALEDEVPYVRLLAAITLHRAGETTDASPLIAAVNVRAGVREPEDEQAAIEIAGELKLEQARGGLERRAFGVLGFTRDPFAWQARVALAQMGHARAVAGILADLKGWTWETRTLAAAAAGAARLVPARARLLAMLGDEQSANQETIRDALRQIDAGKDARVVADG